MGKTRPILIALLPLFLILCAFTRMDYKAIQPGMDWQEVIRKYGEPYSVESLGERQYEYRYIERISMNNELVYENQYFFLVVNGQITNKRMVQFQRPPYDQLYETYPYYPSYP